MLRLLSLCLLIVGCCILQQHLAKAQNYGACTTPNREVATCIELRNCPELYDLLQNPNITPSERQYLSRSQCGYFNNNVLVCCPKSVRAKVPSSIPRSAGTLPKAPECGVALINKILGGTTTHILEFPWMALLEYRKPGNIMGFHCGGTLISNRYVVTAAHCVVGVPTNWNLESVRLGEWDTTTNPDCDVDLQGNRDCVPEHLDVRVERKIVHPQYIRGSADQLKDIALLKLSNTVASTDHIKPICLPSSSELRDNDFVGTVMDVAGWGRTENEMSSTLKLKAEVAVWELTRCSDKYRQNNLKLDSTQLCAGGEEGVDSCRGDSGGPLMVQRKESGTNAYYLIGVVSYGPNPCGLKDWPGVYTKVGAYVDWIQNNIQVCCPKSVRANIPSSILRSAGTLPKAPECGISFTDKIFGGTTTRILEFPWMAQLEYRKPGNIMGFHCGGTLISNRYVLTAAHCVAGVPSDWSLESVRLGEWDTTTNPDCVVDSKGNRDCVAEYLDVRVERKTVHPQYIRDSNDQLNDIALLRLSNTVTSTDHIKPICLPSSSELRNNDFVGTAMDVAGWGRTETEMTSTLKLKAEVKVWELTRCSAKYRQNNRNLDSTQLCAGGEKGIDSCRGDSGGPLMVQQRDSGHYPYFLVGVVSYGPTPCGLEGWPGVYTKVGAYIDWILNNIE